MNFNKWSFFGVLMTVTSIALANPPEKIALLSIEQLANQTWEEFKQYRDKVTANKVEWESYKKQSSESFDNSAEQYINDINQHLELLDRLLQFLQKQETIQVNYIKNYTHRSMLKRIGDLFTILCFPRMLAHEFGHAVVGKLLHGDPINIHLGAPLEEVPVDKWNIGKTNFTLHSYNFNNGGFAAVVDQEKEKPPLYYAAGPLAGVTVSWYIMNKIIKYAQSTPSKVIRDISVLPAYVAMVLLLADVLHLTPFMTEEHHDGQRIWRKFGLPESYLSKARKITPIIKYITLALGAIYLKKQYLKLRPAFHVNSHLLKQ